MKHNSYGSTATYVMYLICLVNLTLWYVFLKFPPIHEFVYILEKISTCIEFYASRGIFSYIIAIFFYLWKK